MTRIGVAAVSDPETTARYFERAVEQLGYELVPLVSLENRALLATLDIVIVVDPFLRNPRRLLNLPCPSLGYLNDVHQDIQKLRLAYARYFDHVFVGQKDYLHQFDVLSHPSVHWLPLACDPEIHFVRGEDRIYDVGFVGKLWLEGSDRFDTLKKVLPQFSTNDTARFYLPREMGLIYSCSKIVFNKSINGDLNMRFFEALASGALLITDKVGNGLSDVGSDGEHFITYTSANDAIRKIEYYLSHATERKRIAEKGQRLAFERHKYTDRVQTMLDVFRGAPSVKAPARVAPKSIERLWRSECLRISGAPPAEVMSLVADGHLSKQTVSNATIAIARGIVRQLRQRLAS